MLTIKHTSQYKDNESHSVRYYGNSAGIHGNYQVSEEHRLRYQPQISFTIMQMTKPASSLPSTIISPILYHQ